MTQITRNVKRVVKGIRAIGSRTWQILPPDWTAYSIIRFDATVVNDRSEWSRSINAAE